MLTSSRERLDPFGFRQVLLTASKLAEELLPETYPREFGLPVTVIRHEDFPTGDPEDYISRRYTDLFRGGSMGDFRTAISQIPFELQQTFFVRLCERMSFYNPTKLGLFLTEIINYPYFTGREQSRPLLERLSTKSLQTCRYPDIPVKIVRTWREAASAVRHISRKDPLEYVFQKGREVAEESDRLAQFNGAVRLAEELTWLSVRRSNASWCYAREKGTGHGAGLRVHKDPQRYLKRQAGWIIVEDLMPQVGYTDGFPYVPEIYQYGNHPIGVVDIREGWSLRKIPQFVVFAPQQYNNPPYI